MSNLIDQFKARFPWRRAPIKGRPLYRTTGDRYMPVRLPRIKGRVHGGPILDSARHADKYRVCMAAELVEHADHEHAVPTRDFSVPEMDMMVDGIQKGVDILEHGVDLYVGCLGGRGRTGLYMACMAKLMSRCGTLKMDPVEYVRLTYNPHAVETEGQREFVRAFPAHLIQL